MKVCLLCEPNNKWFCQMHVRFAGQTVNEILEKLYRHCTTSQITLNVVPQIVTGRCVDSLAIEVMLCKPVRKMAMMA